MATRRKEWLQKLPALHNGFQIALQIGYDTKSKLQFWFMNTLLLSLFVYFRVVVLLFVVSWWYKSVLKLIFHSHFLFHFSYYIFYVFSSLSSFFFVYNGVMRSGSRMHLVAHENINEMGGTNKEKWNLGFFWHFLAPAITL